MLLRGVCTGGLGLSAADPLSRREPRLSPGLTCPHWGPGQPRQEGMVTPVAPPSPGSGNKGSEWLLGSQTHQLRPQGQGVPRAGPRVQQRTQDHTPGQQAAHGRLQRLQGWGRHSGPRAGRPRFGVCPQSTELETGMAAGGGAGGIRRRGPRPCCGPGLGEPLPPEQEMQNLA